MSDYMDQLQPLIEHVMNHALIYGVGTVVSLLIIFFTRPYSTAVIFYSIEIGIYVFAMHTVVHIIIRLLAWFSNQTSMKNVFEDDARENVFWSTPWLRFWDRTVYDPSWVVWMEIAFVIIIIGLVRYFRPMKVQKKLKSSVKVEKPKGKKKKGEEDDDDWGVATTRRFTMPDDFGTPPPKKK